MPTYEGFFVVQRASPPPLARHCISCFPCRQRDGRDRQAMWPCAVRRNVPTKEMYHEVRNRAVARSIVSARSQSEKSPQGEARSSGLSFPGGTDSLAGIITATGGAANRRQTAALRSSRR